jgi:hypothetical protein
MQQITQEYEAVSHSEYKPQAAYFSPDIASFAPKPQAAPYGSESKPFTLEPRPQFASYVPKPKLQSASYMSEPVSFKPAPEPQTASVSSQPAPYAPEPKKYFYMPEAKPQAASYTPEPRPQPVSFKPEPQAASYAPEPRPQTASYMPEPKQQYMPISQISQHPSGAKPASSEAKSPYMSDPKPLGYNPYLSDPPPEAKPFIQQEQYYIPEAPPSRPASGQSYGPARPSAQSPYIQQNGYALPGKNTYGSGPSESRLPQQTADQRVNVSELNRNFLENPNTPIPASIESPKQKAPEKKEHEANNPAPKVRKSAAKKGKSPKKKIFHFQW